MDEILYFLEAVDQFLDKITPKFSFEAFLEFLSEYYDGKIQEHLAETACKYIGGYCNLCVVNNSLKVDTELYYEENGLYDKHSLLGQVPLKKFTKGTLEVEIEEIIKNGGLRISVEEPKKKEAIVWGK